MISTQLITAQDARRRIKLPHIENAMNFQPMIFVRALGGKYPLPP